MQSSDLPVQLNQAKYEFNGGTGFIQKPWVMMREGGGAGIFNPFTQSKLEDVVPARLSIKVRMSLKLLLYAVELRTCSECLIPPCKTKRANSGIGALFRGGLLGVVTRYYARRCRLCALLHTLFYTGIYTSLLLFPDNQWVVSD